MLDAWDNPVRTRWSRRQTVQRRSPRLGGTRGSSGAVHCFGWQQSSRGNSLCWGAGRRRAENALSHSVLMARPGSQRAEVACHCIIGSTHCNSSPYRSTPTAPIHGLSTFQTLAPSLASIPGTSFAVSPSPKHAPTPVTSTTPAALAVARSQQTGCRHGTKERVLEAQGWQSFSLPWLSSVVSAHWRWVIVRRGSAAAAVCCTQYISSLPMPIAPAVKRPFTQAYTVQPDPIAFLGNHCYQATSRARGFCVLLPGWLYTPV